MHTVIINLCSLLPQSSFRGSRAFNRKRTQIASPTQQGRMLVDQEIVGDFLGTFSGTTGIQGTEGTNSELLKPLSF